MFRQSKRIRLKNRDYKKPSWYFVTIVTDFAGLWFGDVVDDQMALNEFGEIVSKQWQWLGERYDYVRLGNYVVMPNHVHGLIRIMWSADSLTTRTGRDLSLHHGEPKKTKSLSSLIGAFKTTSSKKIHETGQYDFAWQRSFHERIVRSTDEYWGMIQYMKNNSRKWSEDNYYPVLSK